MDPTSPSARSVQRSVQQSTAQCALMVGVSQPHSHSDSSTSSCTLSCTDPGLVPFTTMHQANGIYGAINGSCGDLLWLPRLDGPQATCMVHQRGVCLAFVDLPAPPQPAWASVPCSKFTSLDPHTPLADV